MKTIRKIAVQIPFKFFDGIDWVIHIPMKIASKEYTPFICKIKGTHDYPESERAHANFYSKENDEPTDYLECLECFEVITVPCECDKKEEG